MSTSSVYGGYGVAGSPGRLIDAWRGVWNSTGRYVRGDLVSHDNSLYLAAGDPAGTEPPLPPWQVFVEAPGLGNTGRGGMLTIAQQTVVGDSNHLKLAVSAGTGITANEAGELVPGATGLWAISGTLTLTSVASAPYSATLDTWMGWQHGGQELTSTADSWTRDIGNANPALRTYTVPFDFCVLLHEDEPAYLACAEFSADFDQLTVSGTAAVGLVYGN